MLQVNIVSVLAIEAYLNHYQLLRIDCVSVAWNSARETVQRWYTQQSEDRLKRIGLHFRPN